MDLIINALGPVFAMILLGGIAEKTNILPTQTADALNKFVYYFTMPILLFGSLAEAELSDILRYDFIAANFIAYFSVFAFVFFYSYKILRHHIIEADMRALSAAFPNTSFAGIPVLLGLMSGDARAIIASASATFITTLLFGASIAIAEIGNSGKASLQTIKKVVFSVIFNPIICGSILGVIFAAANIELHQSISSFWHTFGMASVPCSLFAVGQVIARTPFTATWCELSTMTTIKLILQPVLAFCLLYLFGVRGDWLFMGVILAAMPSAVITYLVADIYTHYPNRAASNILVTTALSALTIAALTMMKPWFY
ncbi:MAG: AEC family transporter [Desulfovibrio sp.]